MTFEEVAAKSKAQNPFLLAALNRELKQNAITLIGMFGACVAGHANNELAEQAMAIDKANDDMIACIKGETAKPKLHVRAGQTRNGNIQRMDSARAYVVFTSDVSNTAALDVWRSWGYDPTGANNDAAPKDDPDGATWQSQPAHIYRNAKHVMISQWFVRQASSMSGGSSGYAKGRA